MGYRFHFYRVSKDDVESLLANKPADLTISYHFPIDKEVFCVESRHQKTFWDVFKKADYLFPESFYDSISSDYDEESDDYKPRVLSKELLKELILSYRKQYLAYLLDIMLSDSEQASQKDIFNRILYLNTPYLEADTRHFSIWGPHDFYKRYISLAGEQAEERFIKDLDNSSSFLGDNTEYDILVNMIYLYKTFTDEVKIVMEGW